MDKKPPPWPPAKGFNHLLNGIFPRHSCYFGPAPVLPEAANRLLHGLLILQS
jgi:hypothetical protein